MQHKSEQSDYIYPSLTRETNSSEDGEKVGVPDPGPDDMTIVMFRDDEVYSRFYMNTKFLHLASIPCGNATVSRTSLKT